MLWKFYRGALLWVKEEILELGPGSIAEHRLRRESVAGLKRRKQNDKYEKKVEELSKN